MEGISFGIDRLRLAHIIACCLDGGGTAVMAGKVRGAMRQTRGQLFKPAIHWLAVTACVLSLLGGQVVAFLRITIRANSATLNTTRLPNFPTPVNGNEEEENHRVSDSWRHQHRSYSLDRTRRDYSHASRCWGYSPHRWPSADLWHLPFCVVPLPLAWSDPFCNGLGAPYLC